MSIQQEILKKIEEFETIKSDIYLNPFKII